MIATTNTPEPNIAYASVNPVDLIYPYALVMNPASQILYYSNSVGNVNILGSNLTTVSVANSIIIGNSTVYLTISQNGISFSNGLTIIQGYTGSNGVTGYTGSPGYTGSRGITSVQGTLGYVGSFGGQGGLGPTGFTGSPGPAGNSGYQGSPGDVQGLIGYTGSVGYTGSPGIPGGSTGANGGRGATGYTGSFGYTGSPGNQGSNGVRGYTGSSIQGITGGTFASLSSAPGKIAYITDGPSGLGWGANVTAGGHTTPYLLWWNNTHWTVL